MSEPLTNSTEMFYELYIKKDDEIKALEDQLELLKAKREECRQAIIKYMVDNEIDKITIYGRTFSHGHKLVAKIDDKVSFFKYLRDTQNDEILSVNFNTLNSFTKEYIDRPEANKMPPPGVTFQLIDKLNVRKA